MQLITERLRLTTLQQEDWLFFWQVHTDEQSMHWISGGLTDEGIRERFTMRLDPWLITSHHMLCLVVSLKESGEKLGLIGANAEWSPHRKAEVGYAFLHEHCGQGYGSEALDALCDFLLSHCQFHKLTAQVVEGNHASRRALEKNGFLLEGLLRDNYLLRDQWVNDWVFGRLNPHD